jgi:uncharacterized protein
MNHQLIVRILHFPVVKLILGLAICISVGFLGLEATNRILISSALTDTQKDLAGSSVSALLVIIVYCLFFRWCEKRRITELSIQKLPKNFVLGAISGSVILSLTIYWMFLLGDFTILSSHPFLKLLPDMGVNFTNSIIAETLFIGIFFRILEEKLGSWFSVWLMTAIFAVIHLMIPQGSIAGALAIGLNAGFLLGASYIFTRSLWCPIGIHFAWDFMQSHFYGASVNGIPAYLSLFTTRIEGPNLISGGYFGPQGSIQSGLFCLSAGFLFMAMSQKRKRMIQPNWKIFKG